MFRGHYTMDWKREGNSLTFTKGDDRFRLTLVYEPNDQVVGMSPSEFRYWIGLTDESEFANEQLAEVKKRLEELKGEPDDRPETEI